MKNARAHWGVRSLGRTHWMTDALTRRMRSLYQARMQWLRDLERAGLQPRLLILDTCVGLTVRQVRVMEATYIATYWTRTRLFNSNCPASVEGFTRFGDLVKRPATPPSRDATRAAADRPARLQEQRDALPYRDDWLTRYEARWRYARRSHVPFEEACRVELQRRTDASREMLRERRLQRRWAALDPDALPPIAAAANAAQGHALYLKEAGHYRCRNAGCSAWGGMRTPDDTAWTHYAGTNRPCPYSWRH